MKSEPISLSAKSPRQRFTDLGTKVMSVSKDEIEKREKQWRNARKRGKKKWA